LRNKSSGKKDHETSNGGFVGIHVSICCEEE
jgi:hypothetical protein